MKNFRTFITIALAFAAGAIASRLTLPAQAAPAPLTASYIDLNSLQPADFPPPNPALPNIHTKQLATIGSSQIAYSVGLAPKHTHELTTEIQLVLAGSGTEWLGDKQIPIGPGTFVIIPPSTAHGGFTGGPFKLYTIKSPPQDPTDYHAVP